MSAIKSSKAMSTATQTREQIMKILRSVNSLSVHALFGRPLDMDGKINFGLQCSAKDFDEALASIDKTHWFERLGNQFLIGKITVVFYVVE